MYLGRVISDVCTCKMNPLLEEERRSPELYWNIKRFASQLFSDIGPKTSGFPIDVCVINHPRWRHTVIAPLVSGAKSYQRKDKSVRKSAAIIS